jgi:DNA-3-methyladenine glycosylase I
MPENQAPKQIKVKSLNDYLEVMRKAVFQSGMSWKVIESKWPGIREAFANFDIQKVADFDERDFERLSQDTRVIRNYRKLTAIASNAGKILELDKQHRSFQRYLRSHGSFDKTLAAMRKDFKFMGPFGVYYFLYVVGEEVPTHERFRKQYGKK